MTKNDQKWSKYVDSGKIDHHPREKSATFAPCYIMYYLGASMVKIDVKYKDFLR